MVLGSGVENTGITSIVSVQDWYYQYFPLSGILVLECIFHYCPYNAGMKIYSSIVYICNWYAPLPNVIGTVVG